jgi:hypothetical protein
VSQYGCDTWSLILREVHRLRVFENNVVGKIFGPKRNEMTGEWRKLYSGRNTRFNNKLHFPTCNLAEFQKGIYYHVVKVFNGLPPTIRILAYDVKLFKLL